MHRLLQQVPRDLLGLALMGVGAVVVLISLPVPVWLWATLIGATCLGAGWYIHSRR